MIFSRIYDAVVKREEGIACKYALAHCISDELFFSELWLFFFIEYLQVLHSFCGSKLPDRVHPVWLTCSDGKYLVKSGLVLTCNNDCIGFRVFACSQCELCKSFFIVRKRMHCYGLPFLVKTPVPRLHEHTSRNIAVCILKLHPIFHFEFKYPQILTFVLKKKKRILIIARGNYQLNELAFQEFQSFHIRFPGH